MTDLSPSAAVLLTTFTKHRYPWFSDPTTARQTVSILHRLERTFDFSLHTFVLMPDHCILLLTLPPSLSASTFMRAFKSGVTAAIGKGSIWQPRFKLERRTDIAAALRELHARQTPAPDHGAGG